MFENMAGRSWALIQKSQETTMLHHPHGPISHTCLVWSCAAIRLLQEMPSRSGHSQRTDLACLPVFVSPLSQQQVLRVIMGDASGTKIG